MEILDRKESKMGVLVRGYSISTYLCKALQNEWALPANVKYKVFNENLNLKVALGLPNFNSNIFFCNTIIVGSSKAEKKMYLKILGICKPLDENLNLCSTNFLFLIKWNIY